MDTKDDNRMGHLYTILQELSSSILAKQRKYFHLNTIDNLIFHFADIKTEIDKKWVYESLIEYFRVCADIMPSIDRNTRAALC